MMFYNKKYDYVCWCLVYINVCQGKVASNVSLQQHIDLVAVTANAKEAAHPNLVKRKWMVRLFVNLNSDLMLQISVRGTWICRVGLIHSLIA